MQSVQLNSYNSFLYWCLKFDSTYKTQTYICNITLKEIDENFVKRNYQQNIQDNIDKVFYNSNTINTANTDVEFADLQKINSFHNFKVDFSQGKKFEHPVNLHYFGEGRCVLQPGTTRIFFKDIYHLPVAMIVTDYSGDFYKKFKHLNPLFPASTSINVKNLYFITHSAKGHNYINEVSQNPELIIKQIRKNVEHDSYTNPKLNDPSKTFELSNNKVFVDGDLLLYKQQNRWIFNIENIC